MICYNCVIIRRWKTRLITLKEKESSGEPIQRVAVLSPTTVRDTKKLAISTYNPPRVLPSKSQSTITKRI